MAENADNLIADLVKPGRVVAYGMVDGTTARASAIHDKTRPMVLDVMDTLAAAKESGKFLQVDSIDDDSGNHMDLFINVDAVVSVKIESVGNILGAVK
jgi:hypothetical protein